MQDLTEHSNEAHGSADDDDDDVCKGWAIKYGPRTATFNLLLCLIAWVIRLCFRNVVFSVFLKNKGRLRGTRGSTVG
jgi:hypothetical protein